MSKTAKKFSIGVDYGTNSVRALIVDITDGSEVASSVYNYPSGEDGVIITPKDPLLARQNPADYIEGFYHSVSQAVKKAKKNGFKPELVAGIGVDTTGSTPIPVDQNGTPLALLKEFQKEPAAQAWLWKDHTAYSEAAKITETAQQSGVKYLDKCGGRYSSEWYWSKILHCKQENPRVFKAAYSWVELADFIPAFLTGNTDPHTLSRGICAAGHKAMYHEQWGGLPDEAFLRLLDPDIVPLRERFAARAKTSDQAAGTLLPIHAKKSGLLPNTPVAVGAFDAHMGAVGSGIKPGTLVKIIGTSTCDMMVHPLDKSIADIPGLCGIVPGSVMPDMYGLEAGQSAVGDIFNWFVKNLAPSKYTDKGDAHVNLSRDAARLLPGESGLLALDWNNGNRTVLVDQQLTGQIIGMTLHTGAPEIYRTLIEATAFGALTIIKRFEEYGVPVKEVVNCGGIAEKSPLTMQIYADVCNKPMKISRSPQTCALGAAIFGAVAGRAFQSVQAAQKKMTGTKPTVYKPNKKAVPVYEKLYALYRELHDSFGVANHKESLYHIMKKLIAIREAVK
ncbi:MAG: ribulokinase [Planctomycetaceae bacterium]|nr:ribulokinase [Planctomycetaceae bacterium]